MILTKTFLPLLALSACLGGCVYEEVDTGYREPRRVHHGGYVEQEVVVERRPNYYREDRPREYYQEDRSRDYYRERPVTVYQDRPRAYYNDSPQVYGGGYAVIPGRHGESYKEHQERELREAQRERREDQHDKKDDDHKKKKKKDHDDDH